MTCHLSTGGQRFQHQSCAHAARGIGFVASIALLCRHMNGRAREWRDRDGFTTIRGPFGSKAVKKKVVNRARTSNPLIPRREHTPLRVEWESAIHKKQGQFGADHAACRARIRPPWVQTAMEIQCARISVHNSKRSPAVEQQGRGVPTLKRISTYSSQDTKRKGTGSQGISCVMTTGPWRPQPFSSMTTVLPFQSAGRSFLESKLPKRLS